MIYWKRWYDGGYECSGQGDGRFSAFSAVMPDGRTIEQWYQCDIKGYDLGGTNWRLGKGKPPKNAMTPQMQWEAYLSLWKIWAVLNPDLMDELHQNAIAHDRTLTDKFASTPVNQAHALATILNDWYELNFLRFMETD